MLPLDGGVFFLRVLDVLYVGDMYSTVVSSSTRRNGCGCEVL